jgi:serine/threonine-protein kinase
MRPVLCPSCNAETGEVSKFCPACGGPIVRATVAEDIVGKLIAGKFRVESLLGEGGMGKVYKAKQVALDKVVVLKVLRTALLSDAGTVGRFQREAKAASRLNHPNSISMLDFGQAEDGSLYIAMEFVSGKDLHHIIAEQWPLPEERVVRIITQVLSAVGDAHLAGVIHRDLKPENIMVEQRRGDPDFVKVLDFGIAKVQDTSEDGPALTRAGFVCGTPEYMSPEQARGAQLDARSDLYAIGVILYQMVTGLLPFESDSAVGFATKHLVEPPPEIPVRRPDAKVSPAMQDLIMRSLSKDPAGRPQTAELFRNELFAVLDGTAAAISPARRTGQHTPGAPIPLTATAQAAQAAKGGKSMTAVKAATGALIAVALGLGGFFVWQLTSTPATAAPVKGGAPASGGPAASASNEGKPLHEQTIPQDKRDPAASARLEREGDMFHRTGQVPEALAKYQAAFAADPTPELSLKLGEVYFQSNQLPLAKSWWARHLRDDQGTKARKYVLDAMPDLAL